MPKKILLADDSITIQKVVELTFSDGDYEVVAVNNGAKAIQKLSEMRPDIILSDIIMPEKNGYEVCEFVKSHPDFRTIPVVLLTGTFEPFDPDRADKAGCDAVVTKPFESQSLIHKVEELVSAAKSAPPAPPAAASEPAFAAPADSPWADEPAPAETPFGGGGFQPHGSDIFGAAPAAPAAPAGADMPFETADSEAFSGETRAFPRMSFEDMQAMMNAPSAPAPQAPIPPSEAPEEPPQIESSPWDEPAQPAGFSGETRAFPSLSFDAMSTPAAEPEPEQPAQSMWSSEPETSSPFAEPPASEFSGETRAFPRMSFDDLQKMAATPAPAEPEPIAMPEPAPHVPEPSPWEEETPAFGGETRAFPRMSFEQLQQMASQPAEVPEVEAAPAETSSMWSEPAPSVFDAPPVAEPEPEAPRADSSLWSEPEPPSWTAPPVEEPFAGTPEPEPVATPEPEPAPMAAEPAASPAPAAAASSSAAAVSGDLSDEQIDRIARRVVQMLSADVVKSIAWEVIPDMAKVVVQERIRELESEA